MIFTSKGFINATQAAELMAAYPNRLSSIAYGNAAGDVIELVNQQRLSEKDIRFFLGYSGWSEGQLEGEMKQKSWIVTSASKTLVFRNDIDNTWKDALKQLGGKADDKDEE